jgi:hypothetical protein
MKWKEFKLTGGPIKSEFEPDIDYYEIFEKHKLYPGRMISGSKSAPEGHVAVFNGNIVTEKAGKIWYGDLDITLEFDQLKEIADEIGQDLYILKEHDARFENEEAGIKYWKKHAVEIIKCKK